MISRENLDAGICLAHKNCQTKVSQAVVRLPAKDTSHENLVFTDKNLRGQSAPLASQSLQKLGPTLWQVSILTH